VRHTLLMTTQTRAVIHRVHDGGITGAVIGEGNLVDRNLVLVHDPLRRKLAEGTGPRRLRLAIVEGSDDGILEVRDAAATHIMPTGEPDVTLVALELLIPSRAPIEEIPEVLGATSQDAAHDMIMGYWLRMVREAASARQLQATNWPPDDDAIPCCTTCRCHCKGYSCL
jgi:hypothetical protein